jgi:hypothetical protein
MPRSDDDIIAEHGARENANGGIFIPGASYGYEKKLEVAAAYHRGLEMNPPATVTSISRECKVGQKFVDKVLEELNVNGRVLRPTDIEREERCTKISGFAATVILRRYMEEPSRSKRSYRDLLFAYTGIVVCERTINNFFLKSLPFRGSMVKPNLVPLDKFRPENVANMIEFVNFIVTERPRNIKWGDEKNLKGQELYCRKVRRNPLTGEIPSVTTDPDFRNTHNITGFCGIDTRTNPVWYRITRNAEGMNDSECFFDSIVDAINDGFLRCGDVLVLDNAAIHNGGDNEAMAEWLWSRFDIFVAWLPTRSPELNPIELVWSYLVQKLQTYPLTILRQNMRAIGCSSDAAAYVAKEILDGVTHDLVWRCVKHCYKDIISD